MFHVKVRAGELRAALTACLPFVDSDVSTVWGNLALASGLDGGLFALASNGTIHAGYSISSGAQTPASHPDQECSVMLPVTAVRRALLMLEVLRPDVEVSLDSEDESDKLTLSLPASNIMDISTIKDHYPAPDIMGSLAGTLNGDRVSLDLLMVNPAFLDGLHSRHHLQKGTVRLEARRAHDGAATRLVALLGGFVATTEISTQEDIR